MAIWRLLVVTIVLLSAVLVAGVVVPAEDMAGPSHPGWKAAEGSGCMVWVWYGGENEATPIGRVTWSGPCKDNRASGEGELVWQSGRYVGEMHDGKFHGRGTKTLASGERYVGEFVNGRPHGRGTNVWPSGARYDGNFFNGEQTHGTHVWANGDRYEGDFVNAQESGRGTKTWANGDRYEGEFLADKVHGHGTYVWANGDRYEGDFVNNKPAEGAKSATTPKENMFIVLGGIVVILVLIGALSSGTSSGTSSGSDYSDRKPYNTKTIYDKDGNVKGYIDKD